MKMNQYPVLHPQVASRTVEEQAVVVLSDAGEVTVLNPVGTRVWELIDGKRSVEDIAAEIVAEYGASPDVVRRDVQEFVQGLAELRAVELRDEPQPG